MRKRTSKKVLKDAQIIMYLLERGSNLEDIEKQTGLSERQIKYSLEKVGQESELKKRIKENYLANSQKSRSTPYTQKVRQVSRKDKRRKKHYHGINTLYGTHLKDGNLIFEIKNNSHCYSQLIVKENNFVYTNGEHKLSIGDEVIIIRKTKRQVLFLHYEVISLEPSKNVRVKYNRKFNENIGIEDLEPDFYYTVFIRDAILYFKALDDCLKLT